MTPRQMIDKFMQVFNTTEESAFSYLQFYKWDYEKATDAYWRQNILIY